MFNPRARINSFKHYRTQKPWKLFLTIKFCKKVFYKVLKLYDFLITLECNANDRFLTIKLALFFSPKRGNVITKNNFFLPPASYQNKRDCNANWKNLLIWSLLAAADLRPRLHYSDARVSGLTERDPFITRVTSKTLCA